MTKKFFALALMLMTIIFVGMAEAGIVTDRFPLFCYVDHQVDTYNQPNGQKVGYISANVDLIRVTQVRGDGWAYGDYPGRNGRVARWFRINELCADPAYSNRGTNIRGAQNVFRTKNGGDFIGSVSNNEEVIVLADNGNRAQILYKLNNNTGWKMGWVPSSTVSSRNVQPVVPSPIANTVTISDGWYRIQPMHDLSRSADALGTPIGNGNNIHMWTVADIPQQKFYLQNRGNGYFSLQSNYGNKLFVTADGRGNGANLYTSDWKNSDSQLFRLVNAGNNSYHVFAKVGVNLNFDCAGAGRGDGTNLQLWTSENNDWHKWRFTKISVDNKADFRLNNYSLTTPSNYQLRFTGKLWNANNLSEITGVHVYIGGGVGAGGQFLGEFRADKTNHNFDSTLNVPQNRSGNQLVVIYAVNGIESKELDRRNINIQGNNPTPSSKLQSLINEWEGKTWSNHYYSPNGIECKEFAAFVYNKLYGLTYSDVGSTSGNKYTLAYNSNKIGCRASQSNLTTSNVRTLYQNAQPGDFIQMRRNHGGAHSAILVSKDDNGVTWFEANADGANGIRKYRYTYDELVNGVRKGNKVYWVNVAMSIYYAK